MQGIGFNEFFLEGLRVKQDQPGKVHVIPLVGNKIYPFIVFVKSNRIGCFKDAGSVNRCKPVIVNPQDVVAPIGIGPHGKAQLVVPVKYPSGYAVFTRILTDECTFACRKFHPV